MKVACCEDVTQGEYRNLIRLAEGYPDLKSLVTPSKVPMVYSLTGATALLAVSKRARQVGLPDLGRITE